MDGDEMKRNVLGFALAMLTFAVGVGAAAVFLPPPGVPPAAISPPPLEEVTGESSSGREAMPLVEERRPISRRVVGYVKDRENRPVAGAEVCANPHGGGVGGFPCAGSRGGGS